MYIDPGAGSIFIQAMIGLAFAIPILIKVYFNRIKNIVNRRKNKK